MLKKIQDQQDQLDEGLQETTKRFEAMEVKLDSLKRLDSMEENIKLSMTFNLNTSKTLKQLQENQKDLLAMIGDIADEAKHSKLQRQASAAAQTKSQTINGSEVHQSEEQQMTSLAEANRVRESLSHAVNPNLPKKQKSVHDETSLLAEAGNLAIPEGFPTADDLPPPLTTIEDPNLMNLEETTPDQTPAEETMEFYSEDDETSMNTALTDLDDQYNFFPDPDGGEPD